MSAPYLSSDKTTGYTNVTEFVFTTDMPDTKIIDYGDGITELFSSSSISHVFVSNGKFTVTVMMECSEYPTILYSTVVEVKQFVQNTITYLANPLTGYSSEEEDKKFYVEVTTNCPPPLRIDLLAKNTDSKHILDGDIRGVCEPVNYFYSDEEMDGDTVILDKERVGNIVVNGASMGYIGKFCFGYYDDYVGDVDILSKLDVSCDYISIKNQPTFYNCVGIDPVTVDIQIDFSHMPNLYADELTDAEYIELLGADITKVIVANATCRPIEDGEYVEDIELINGILNGQIIWSELPPPPTGVYKDGSTGQSRGLNKYISDITLPDFVEGTNPANPNIYRKMTLGYNMKIGGDNDIGDMTVVITFDIKHCENCCDVEPPKPPPIYKNAWVLVWNPQSFPTPNFFLDDTFAAVDPANGETYYANGMGRYGTCPAKSPTRWHNRNYPASELIYPDPYDGLGNYVGGNATYTLIDPWLRNGGNHQVLNTQIVFRKQQSADEHYHYYDGVEYEILVDEVDGVSLDPNDIEHYASVIDNILIVNFQGPVGGEKRQCFWEFRGRIQVNG